MRGIDATLTERPRTVVGRELEPVSLRPDNNRLHVDRPCYVGRHDRGGWVWNCTLCPLPFQLSAYPADTWRSAIDTATAHVRAAHSTARTDSVTHALAA